LVSCAGTARADSLLLNDHVPDTAVQDVGVTYDYSTGQLTVYGLAVNTEPGLSTPACAFCSITNSAPIGTVSTPGGPLEYNLEILASIDSSGNIEAGTNTLEITGSVNGLSDGSPLLTGNLSEFGGASGLYEFVFTATGGSLAGLYGGDGSPVGVILIDASLPADLDSNFSTNFSGAIDVGSPLATPEPASLLLLLSGGTLLGLLRRRS
jgi:hypothetical protein